MSRTIIHKPDPEARTEPEPTPIIVGEIYHDPNGGAYGSGVTGAYQWYIGSEAWLDSDRAKGIVDLVTGVLYLYDSGELPPSIVRAEPGSLTLTLP